jgi:glutathione S-transferase
VLTLISATPSPSARKNGILMLEKGIPFELKNEIPWRSTTETPQYNPLEKLPILIVDDGKSPIYESWYIQEYLVQKDNGTGPALIPESLDDQHLAKKIQVLADGACDAMGLTFFESGRGELKSEEWYARQLRKVNGVLKAMDELVMQSGGRYLVGDEFSIADIAVGSMLGLMNMVETQFGLVKWLEQHPKLKEYWGMLEARDSFQQTQPVMFELTEKVPWETAD